MVSDIAFEVYVGIVAIGFTAIGLWFAIRLRNPKVDHREAVNNLVLTTREHEVLELLMQGHSNAEIAGRLFLSLSTVKTHVSTLFVKMGVKSRTQAMEKANRLKIRPHTLVGIPK